jgi:hypothetical protein
MDRPEACVAYWASEVRQKVEGERAEGEAQVCSEIG